MKKAIVALLCVLLALTVLYPAGVMVTARMGYRFELISVPAFAVAIAVLSVCIVALALVCESPLENKGVRVLLAVMTPLSFINAVLYIFACPHVLVIASVVLPAGCCGYLTVAYGKSLAFRITALVLFGVMVLSIGFVGFIAFIFGNIGTNTVVKTVESPSGKYYAQVIDSDQGALGGDTLVTVYEECGINAFLFTIEKKPQQVYFGNWGEYEHMQIHWKDDTCLVINAVEYAIE